MNKLIQPLQNLFYIKPLYKCLSEEVKISPCNLKCLIHWGLVRKGVRKIFLKCHCVKINQIRRFSWSVFSYIRIFSHFSLCISPYSVRMRENTYQKKLRRIWTLFTHCVIWESQVGRVGDLKEYLTFGEEGVPLQKYGNMEYWLFFKIKIFQTLILM